MDTVLVYVLLKFNSHIAITEIFYVQLDEFLHLYTIPVATTQIISSTLAGGFLMPHPVSSPFPMGNHYSDF